MRLKAEHVDMRGGYPTDVYWSTDVIDLDTGKIVGTIHNERPRNAAFRFLTGNTRAISKAQRNVMPSSGASKPY